ncbi:MAG: hypothetical protein AB1489_39720, partial [Acidobacteriota bacterium]
NHWSHRLILELSKIKGYRLLDEATLTCWNRLGLMAQKGNELDNGQAAAMLNQIRSFIERNPT